MQQPGKYFKVQTLNIQSVTFSLLLKSHKSSLIMESTSKNSINGFNKISYLPQVDFIFFLLSKTLHCYYQMAYYINPNVPVGKIRINTSKVI